MHIYVAWKMKNARFMGDPDSDKGSSQLFAKLDLL